MDVTSSVPQGPVIFHLHINDTDYGLHCKIFPDYTKLRNKSTLEHQLQNYIDKLMDWAYKKEQMNFNIDKCKVLRIGSAQVRILFNCNR